MNDLKHVGVLGMKWGKRKTRNLTPPTRHLSKRGGKTEIITRRWGDKKIIRRTPASPKQVEAFLAKQKAKRLADLDTRNQRKAVINKVAANVIAAYSLYQIARMVAPRQTTRVLGSLAWTFGRVVSNSPLT